MSDSVDSGGSERPALNAVGKALLLARNRRGLSQRDAARRAGVNPSYLAAIENGRRSVPLPETIARMVNALELGNAERSHVEYLAAVQRMYEANPIEVNRSRRFALALELVAQLVEHDDRDLRLLLGLSRQLIVETEARRESLV